MKLSEIKLLEAYKAPIGSIDDVIALLKKHCSDAITPENLAKPIVRGMSGGWAYQIITGEDGQRKSAHGSNHYTVILDHVLPKEFPRRGKSIICGNFENRNYARTYGDLYVIFPFNDTKIGYLNFEDIYETKITLGNKTEKIYVFNKIFKDLKINDSSYEEILNGIFENHEEFGLPNDKEIINKNIYLAYNKPFSVTTTSNPTYNYDDNPRELWIGGKCIAIKYDKLLELKERLN